MDNEPDLEDDRGGHAVADVSNSSSGLEATKLPRHVEQAATARTAMRKSRTTAAVHGDGSTARELLGDEHGSLWDMMDWANAVLGRSESSLKEATSPRLLSRLESLDAARLRRLVDHVLQKLRATESWACRCGRTNTCEVGRCEACFLARGKGERRHASPSVSTDGSGTDEPGGAGGEGERKILSSTETRLWTKLAELRDLPAMDSLVAFPERLDGNTISAMFDEDPSLRACVVRFLMECDEALTMRNTGYLNPLYHHYPPDTSPTVFATATTIDSTDVSPRPASPAGEYPSVSTTSSQSESENGGPQPQTRRWRWLLPSRAASMSALFGGGDALGTVSTAKGTAGSKTVGVGEKAASPLRQMSCPQSATDFSAMATNTGGILRVGGRGCSAGSDEKSTVRRAIKGVPLTSLTQVTKTGSSPSLPTSTSTPPTMTPPASSVSSPRHAEIPPPAPSRSSRQQKTRGAKPSTVDDSPASTEQLQGLRLLKAKDDGAAVFDESVSPSEQSPLHFRTGALSPRWSKAGNHKTLKAVDSANPSSWISEKRPQAASRRARSTASCTRAGEGVGRILPSPWKISTAPERPPSSASPPSPRHRGVEIPVIGDEKLDVSATAAAVAAAEAEPEERRVSGVSDETVKALKGVRRLWERRAGCDGRGNKAEDLPDGKKEHLLWKRVERGQRVSERPPSARSSSRGVGDLKALFEKQSDRSDRGRSEGRRQYTAARGNASGSDGNVAGTISTNSASTRSVSSHPPPANVVSTDAVSTGEPGKSVETGVDTLHDVATLGIRNTSRADNLKHASLKEDVQIAPVGRSVQTTEVNNSTIAGVHASAHVPTASAATLPLEPAKVPNNSLPSSTSAPVMADRQGPEEAAAHVTSGPEPDLSDPGTGQDNVLEGGRFFENTLSKLHESTAQQSEENTPTPAAEMVATITAGRILERNCADLSEGEQARVAIEILEQLVGPENTHAKNKTVEERRAAVALLEQMATEGDAREGDVQEQARAAVSVLEVLVGGLSSGASLEDEQLGNSLMAGSPEPSVSSTMTTTTTAMSAMSAMGVILTSNEAGQRDQAGSTRDAKENDEIHLEDNIRDESTLLEGIVQEKQLPVEGKPWRKAHVTTELSDIRPLTAHLEVRGQVAKADGGNEAGAVSGNIDNFTAAKSDEVAGRAPSPRDSFFSASNNAATRFFPAVAPKDSPGIGEHQRTFTQDDLFKYGILGPVIMDDVDDHVSSGQDGGSSDVDAAELGDPSDELGVEPRRVESDKLENVLNRVDTGAVAVESTTGLGVTVDGVKPEPNVELEPCGLPDGMTAGMTPIALGRQENTLPSTGPPHTVESPINLVLAVPSAPHFDGGKRPSGDATGRSDVQSAEAASTECCATVTPPGAERIVDGPLATAPVDAGLCPVSMTTTNERGQEDTSGNAASERMAKTPQVPQTSSVPQTPPDPNVKVCEVMPSTPTPEGVHEGASIEESRGSLASPPVMMEKLNADREKNPPTAFPVSAVTGSIPPLRKTPSVTEATAAAVEPAMDATSDVGVTVVTLKKESASPHGAKQSPPREEGRHREDPEQFKSSPLRLVKHPTLSTTATPVQEAVPPKERTPNGILLGSSVRPIVDENVGSTQSSPFSRDSPRRRQTPKAGSRRQSFMDRIESSMTDLLFDNSPDAAASVSSAGSAWGGGRSRGTPRPSGVVDSRSHATAITSTNDGETAQRSKNPLDTPGDEQLSTGAKRSGSAVPSPLPDSIVASPRVDVAGERPSGGRELSIAILSPRSNLRSPQRGSLSPGPWMTLSPGSRQAPSPRRRASLSPGPRAAGLSPWHEVDDSFDLRLEEVPERVASSYGKTSSSTRSGGRGIAALKQAAAENDAVSDVSQKSPVSQVRAFAADTSLSIKPKSTIAPTTKPSAIASNNTAGASTGKPSDGTNVSGQVAEIGSGYGHETSSSPLESNGGDVPNENCDDDGGHRKGGNSGGGGDDGGRNDGSDGYDTNETAGSGRGCQALPREVPTFIAEAISFVGSLRTLAACQAVSRSWRRAVGGDRGEALFGSIVRASGVPASLRPSVWHTLVVRAVSCVQNGGDGKASTTPMKGSSPAKDKKLSSLHSFAHLVETGRAGPHGALIARDVPRAFGSVAPHKRRERGDGSIPKTHVTADAPKTVATSSTLPTATEPTRAWFAAAAAAFTGTVLPGDDVADPFGSRGGGGGAFTHRRFDRGGVGGVKRDLPGLGLLTDIFGLGPDQQEQERPFTSRTPAGKSRRASLSMTGLTGGAGAGPWQWLPAGVGNGSRLGARDDGDERARSRRSSLSLSPPRSSPNRSNSPPRMVLSPPSTSENRPPTGVVYSSARRRTGGGILGARPVVTGGPCNAADARQDTAWLVEAEAAWDDVPVEAKRQGLGNVLFAIAARFPDVGYCQGMDRLLAMLMKFYFIEPQDTMIGFGGQRQAPALSPSRVPLPVTPGAHKSTTRTPDLSQAVPTFFPSENNSGVSQIPAAAPAAAHADEAVVEPDRVEANTSSDSSLRLGNRNGDIDSNTLNAGKDGNETRESSPPVSGPARPPSAALNTATEEENTETPSVMLGERVYAVFAGLFEGFRLHDLYLPERGGVLVCTEVLQLLARRRLPELTRHFDAIDFSLDMVAMGWFQTLFVYLHAMPRATVRRIWDWWLSSGDFEVFFRVSMAILSLSNEILLGQDFDSTVEYFNHFPQRHVLAPDVLLPCAARVEVEDGELMYLELQVRNKENLEVPSVTQLMLRPVL